MQGRDISSAWEHSGGVITGVRRVLHWPIVWVAGFALFAGSFLLFTGAAGFTSSREVEDGNRTGAAAEIYDNNASGGRAVKFGAGNTDAVPTGLKGFTGGDSIGLRWRPVQTSGSVKYHVIRNGVKIAETNPATADAWGDEEPGVRFVDTAVTPGDTYVYNVASEVNGVLSPLSERITLTHPTNNTVPTLNVERNGITTAEPFLETGVEVLQVWYPKIVQMMTGGSYSAPMSLTMRVVPDTYGLCADNSALAWAQRSDSSFNVCEGFASTHPNDANVVLHESAHLVQKYNRSIRGDITPMTIEGIPDWAADSITGRINPPPRWPQNFTDGYDVSSLFLTWVQDTYNKPYIVRDINNAAHYGGAAGQEILRQQTGKTAGQLFTELAGYYSSSAALLTSDAGVCADLTNAQTAVGTVITTHSCHPQSSWLRDYQRVVLTTKASNPSNGGSIYFPEAHKCMGTKNNSKAIGTEVVLVNCNDSQSTSRWRQQGAAVKNIGSGYCLQTNGAMTHDGNPLKIGTCQGISSEPTRRWTLPPN
ncbi:hypothetical protein CR970_03485 [Candidatus Saccharibacteria bacterium]|nr:MAG: hypothetical protein CR970_03485 [Candidatus Saccharibacteria bacterium]